MSRAVVFCQGETRPGQALLSLRQKLLGVAHACRRGVQPIHCTRNAIVKRVGSWRTLHNGLVA